MRGRVKFRVGQIVYIAFERDETIMGFAFPKELRAAVDRNELHMLVVSSWRMCVPKKVAALIEV